MLQVRCQLTGLNNVLVEITKSDFGEVIIQVQVLSCELCCRLVYMCLCVYVCLCFDSFFHTVFYMYSILGVYPKKLVLRFDSAENLIPCPD